MDRSYDYIVVGGGLAGTISAFYLSQHGSTLLLERGAIAAGASGAPMGLVNPFMGRKANPVWHWQEALDAFDRLLADADLSTHFNPTGVLRPAAASPQKFLFRDVSRAFPDDTSWLQSHAVKERWPAVSAENGALFIRRGGSLAMGSFVRGVAKAAEARGCEIRTDSPVHEVVPDGDLHLTRLSEGEFRARHVVLCSGWSFGDWPQLRSLPLHAIKGQLIETPIPGDVQGDFPSLSGAGHIVRSDRRLILGSTFRHTFANLDPTEEDSEEIIRKTATLLPVVRVAPVKRTWTGVRVTVPGTRLPILGPVDESGRLWAFTGLGSKGVLMSSLLGSRLPDFLRDPDSIPTEIRP